MEAICQENVRRDDLIVNSTDSSGPNSDVEGLLLRLLGERFFLGYH